MKPLRTFTIPQGDTFVLSPASIKDELGIVATSLSGWDFIFSVRSSRALGDSQAQAEITVPLSGMTISGARLRVPLTPALLEPLAVDEVYYYGLKAKSPTGGIITQDQGMICIEACAAQSFPGSTTETVITTEDGSVETIEDGSPISTG